MRRSAHDLLAAAVVVAAGRGERMGQPDKIMLALAGRPILAHVLDALDAASAVRAVSMIIGVRRV